MAAKKLVAALRTGTFKDSNGKEHTFDVGRLDAIAAAYNPQFHEAPEVIGHPKTDDPAWGWIKSVKREGDILFYEPGDRVPEFQKMIDLRMFKNRSIKLGADGITVKHVGWLGAEAPAVKGLPMTFKAEDEGATIEFSEAYTINTVGNIFQRFREWLIAKFDQDTADSIVNNWEIDELKNLKPDEVVSTAETGNFNEGGEDMGEIDELKKKLKERDDQISEFSEGDKIKTMELARLKKELSDKESAQRKQGFAAFCESKEMEGKIPPAVKPVVIEFMEILSGAQEFEFSEGDGKVKAQPVERFKELLKGLKKTIEFSEVATKDSTGIKIEDSVVSGIASASPKEGGK
ncbi:hypothetical protein COS16_08940 [Candidatus Desantisbacteria bacterium CG02_land_8_20_14_3_00_49_13]|nr:MAG: hypothetical protein COS16_08940 [Candidatus Desantisbacteria bacterium CG02_land_8_20_14_3_00_49_13]